MYTIIERAGNTELILARPLGKAVFFARKPVTGKSNIARRIKNAGGTISVLR